MSLDIEEMYPNIKFPLVESAFKFFAHTCSVKEKTTINKCLKMINFSMINALISFQDQYWEYGGNTPAHKHRLTISGYECAWLVDLYCSYILKMLDSYDIFENQIIKVFIVMTGLWFGILKNP